MDTDTKTEVYLRYMIRRDLPDAIAIEEQCFACPWTEAEFIKHLRQRNNIAMVAEINDRVVAYVLYELWRGKLTIVNLAVSPQFQRKGVGSELVRRLLDKLSYERRCLIDLVVSEDDLVAQLFFKSLNFRAERVIQNAFENSGRDGYLMVNRYKWEPKHVEQV